MTTQLRLGSLAVEVVLKDIKNVHLSVHPPTGRVTISAPARMNPDAIRVFAISKLDWIRRHQRKLRQQERETPREYLDRESHYVWGKRYLMSVIERDQAPTVTLKHSRMEVMVRAGTNQATRAAIVARWYRQQLKAAVPDLIAKWAPILGVKVERAFVQKMKTKWGSCNADARSIRLNTDLAKKPRQCLEYIVVHELLHLRHRRHDDEFIVLLDQHLPTWRHARSELNGSPLGHQEWGN